MGARQASSVSKHLARDNTALISCARPNTMETIALVPRRLLTRRFSRFLQMFVNPFLALTEEYDTTQIAQSRAADMCHKIYV